MEVSKGNSLNSYLKQTKMSFFFFLFFLYKTREQNRSRGRGVPVGEGRGGERVYKGEHDANTVYTCM
jgi:hypothetical protein